MMQTIAEFVRARATDDNTALLHGDSRWSYREFVALCAQRAAWLLANRREGPFHVGILLDNVPEFPFWIGACALAGATMVGINSTRRGADLERDINHSDCQLVVTDDAWLHALDGLRLDCGDERILDCAGSACRALLYSNARAFDNGAMEPAMGSVCKAYVGDSAFEICAKLLQLWGGSGIMDSTGVNRYMRDAKAKCIAEGASEMHYAIIANQLMHGVGSLVRPG